MALPTHPNLKATERSAKKRLHPRNLHNQGYDFPSLISSYPQLKSFVFTNDFGNLSVDYSDAEAVKQLNAALLAHHYQIKGWDIPDGVLCPPIPGRVDYIHYIADLLGVSDSTKSIRMLDVGIGANGIYSLLASRCYGWQCVGSDINEASLNNVATILKKNKALETQITLRHQVNPHQIFEGIIKSGEFYDVSVCNPPFHASAEEALKTHQQKQHNLKLQSNNPTLNFGGMAAELWCNGGEKLFLKKMIRESQQFSAQCHWFTSLVSKIENVKPSIKLIQKLGATEIKQIDMQQGNKITRVIAWTFQ
ncbi:23S rRNA (adenine(1618)-N(6))-methyltransferase RlmF [Methylophaga sulfidovorans]|uniref:Ribosomal RNA large subunit methyltransferase F n=1 Tax=Methylophaga sulfidovorans TaxID=45496 RepID=A0A1I4BRE5_9GAMM|nr:23S rRNA (adenine(1618)-N(6))-methyltransferase RlmF [Methylophaga sulfidovorans]SFK70556.1 23S rRNA m(6)A-1618 methyltransferase [Methylophaga sulfidovorans]